MLQPWSFEFFRGLQVFFLNVEQLPGINVKNCCFITMCKAHSKVTYKNSKNIFITTSAHIIQSSYYIHGPLGDENIFAVLYASLCYGPYTLL